MIVSNALKSAASSPPDGLETVPDQGGNSYSGRVRTRAKQAVSPELAKKVSAYFRCLNGISDDIANMPIQQFIRSQKDTQRVSPDATLMNMAYLLEVKPNRWMTPFIMKKTSIMWLLSWGNSLIWQPAPPAPRELFILPTNMTVPKLDPNGNLWFEVRFPNGQKRYIPSVEVMHVMINSTNGIWGRGILEYASETIGLRLGMSETQGSVQGNGLNPSAYIQVNATLDKAGRQVYKDAYTEAMSGSENEGGLVVFDNKIQKFEPITMKLTDAQFLESINATDLDIANFFRYPAYKLNMGKESYQSNEQQDLDYLKSTLDPHLVQWEQGARLRWLSEIEQIDQYFKFNRTSILRTNSKTRAELYEIEIRSGMTTPNEALALEDRNGYPDGDKHWMTRNNAEIGAPENVPA
jgi:HK97 family phage portal protein